MTDVMTQEQRSRCMSRIKGRDTGPEMVLRRLLWSRGLRYRVHHKLPGRPDMVFVGAKVAVFVDGCFWHGCPKHAVTPKANRAFWATKLAKNKVRDVAVNLALKRAGWTVFRFWEHEVEMHPGKIAHRIQRAVNSP